MGFRDAVRSAWSELTKAADQPTTQSLALQAKAAASMNLAGRTSASPPDQTVQAMNDQGMVVGGPFSPGQPIQQWQQWGDPPREWDFQTGYNIGHRPRAQDGRVSFETLAAIIGSWDTARICVEHIQDDIRSLDWTIVSSDDAADDDVSADIAAARKFMSKPDGYTPFDSWQQKFLEDVLRFDAGALYKQRDRAGRVMALEVVQGTTVAPLLDERGGMPRPPAPAFVQFAQGVPWVWMTADDLIYAPFRPQPESPYGLPPVEWLLLTANTDLRFQWHFLNWFTQGTLPEAFMEAPPDTSSPEQVKKMQAAWDAVMEGDAAQKHKIRWVPAGSHPTLIGEKTFDDAFPLYLMRKCCAAFKVTPSDLGFTEDVNRATADTQMDVQFRVSTLPRIRHLEGIYNRVLQDDLGLRVKFQYDTGREKEDRLVEAQAHQLYVNMGAESPDEVREEVLGLPVDTEHPMPRFVVTRTGITPLRDIIAGSGEVDPQTAGPTDASIAEAEAEEEAEQEAAMAPPPPPPGQPGQPGQDQGGQPAGPGQTPAPPAPGPLPPDQTANPKPEQKDKDEDVQKAARQELSRWRENSRRRVRQGKAPRPFKSEVLDPLVHGAVWTELRHARTVQEVDRCFETAAGDGARLRVAQHLQDAIAAELALRD